MTQNEMPKIEAITPPEQGRSMVEMLGTLAIMGVLSIGGIAGYSYAVTKYKANETMDELNNRAIVYATQLKDGDLFSGTALRNGEFGDKTVLGYGVSATVSEYENEFNVTLSEIPFEVCEQILKNYTIPTEISVNGNIYNDMDENIDICGEGDTNMIFAFNGDLSNDWESVEVSGEPNNGETTELQTGMETTQPKDICQNIPDPYQNCWQNVVKAEAYCASKGGYVLLSDINCDLEEYSSSRICSRLKTLTGYYVVGKMAKLNQLPDNAVGCLCDYNISKNGSIALQGHVENNNIPLCWDDYRDILAEYTGTENEESTTGTSTITQTPTVTHSLSPEVTATVTFTQNEETSSGSCTNMPTYSKCYNNVQEIENYCSSRGGAVYLSQVSCELEDSDSSAKKCSSFNFNSDFLGITFEVIGTFPPMVNSSIGGGYGHCLCSFQVVNGEVFLDGNNSYSGQILCWDDYRAMLSEESKGNMSE